MFDAGALRGLAGRAAGADQRGLSDEELIGSITELEAARRALDAALAHRVQELDRRGTTAEAGMRTAGWLGVQLRLPKGGCHALVRCGDFLQSHPVIDAALSDGRLSFAHVRVLDRLCTPRVAAVFDRVELLEHWIHLAGEVRFEVWQRDVTAFVDLVDADGAHEPRPEDTRGSMGRGWNDALHLNVQFTGADAVEAEAHLNAAVDELFHRYRNDHTASDGELTLPTRAELIAQATLELFRTGRAAGRSGTGPVTDVTLVVRTPEGLPDDLRQPAEGQSDADWLAGLLVTTLDGMPVQRSVARLLCCDPLFRVHVEDHVGEVLDHGRGHRHATRAQRRAAACRFGGCCFPGCDAPASWTDMHHVEQWDADHGPTDQANLAPVCRRHHGVIHRNGWGMRAAPHGFDITTPWGRVIACHAHGRPPDRTPAPA